MDVRLTEIQEWLENSLSLKVHSLQAASQDASFRRYFRVRCDAQDCDRKNTMSDSLIVMDAPPAQESISEFIAINQALSHHNIHTPKIHAINVKQGLLLLEDLGDRTYLDELNEQSELLYQDAIDALLLIQGIGRTDQGGFVCADNKSADSFATYTPPLYDASLIQQELDLFTQWYCQQHLHISLSDSQQSVWNETKEFLVNIFAQQPQVWVHRDYHSRNLMITDERSPGVIDFQDMVWGPISYDLASLFKDCYIEWPRATQLQWLQNYFDKLSASSTDIDFSFEQLVQWVDLTGLQRHLKVLGIFCRLNYRDGKSHYLLDLPLVEKYVLQVLQQYSELDALKSLFLQLQKHA